MPKEHKKRGRREEQKKRKRDIGGDDSSSKRHKNDDAGQLPVEAPVQHDANGDVTHPEALPFYGMLDDEEQEYFKKADDMLELNQFESPEDRSVFIASVYKEAEGKELKIVHTQSCSRLLERLILLSSPDQLKSLFQKFSGQ
jgi:nucleolar protein 9